MRCNQAIAITYKRIIISVVHLSQFTCHSCSRPVTVALELGLRSNIILRTAYKKLLVLTDKQITMWNYSGNEKKWTNAAVVVALSTIFVLGLLSVEKKGWKLECCKIQTILFNERMNYSITFIINSALNL